MRQSVETDPQQVLVDYLDQLLNESAAIPVSEAVTRADVEEPLTTVDEPRVEDMTDTPAIQDVEIKEEMARPAAAVSGGDEATCEPGVPEWAQRPSFQVLLFKVSGITLAVPLDSLNGILEWHEDNITEMPGHAEYFLGVLPERDRQIKLIDTATIVVPAKFRHGHSRDNLEKIILIGDGEWGLACDGVEEVITLAPGDVRWRSQQGQRVWLAGTVIEQMCALLNTGEFVELLVSEQLQVAD